MRHLRQMMNIHYKEHLSNHQVLLQSGINFPVCLAIHRRRLVWLGHLLRMIESRLPKQALLSGVPTKWRRPRGGVRTTCMRQVHKPIALLLAPLHNSVGSVRDWAVDGTMWLRHTMDMTQNRAQWRDCVFSVFCQWPWDIMRH